MLGTVNDFVQLVYTNNFHLEQKVNKTHSPFNQYCSVLNIM